MHRTWIPILLAGCFVSSIHAQDAPQKKVLTHADYDIWNAAMGVSLSPNGQFVAYVQNPPTGDAAVIVRNLKTNSETKLAIGGRAFPAVGASVADEEADDQLPAAPALPPILGGLTGAPKFTPDSKFLYFPLVPTKADIEKANADKKKPEEMPRTVLAYLDPANGQVVQRYEHVKTFNILGDGAGVLVMTTEPKPDPKPEVAPMPKEVRTPAKLDQQPEPKNPGKGGSRSRTAANSAAGDLVVRHLSDGRQSTFPEVSDFSVTFDVKQIAFVSGSKKAEAAGLFFAELFSPLTAAPIKSGPGKYTRLTWDEKQTRLAFLFVEGSATPATGVAPSATTAAKIYLWERPRTTAVAANTAPMAAGLSTMVLAVGAIKLPAVHEILGPGTEELKKGWQFADRTLSFSADGLKLTVATAPEKMAAEQELKKEPNAPPATERSPVANDAAAINLDLWSWKDEAIQPMQKVRAAADRSKTYAAIYFLDSKQFRHLQDDALVVNTPAFGDWGFGYSDKAVRGQTWAFPVVGDYSLVNIRSGDSKPIARAEFGMTASPHHKYLAGFDGKDWFTVGIPDGKKTVLTGKLKEKFFNEDDDHPATIPPYGLVGWSGDDDSLFVYDRFDIWKLAADGSAATNLTQMGRALGLRFRLARVEKAEDKPGEPTRGLDASKPWLLSVENLQTRDTGFYRLLPGQKPKLLVMGARRYGTPTKAKASDAMILTVSTFRDYPDYHSADADFGEWKRVTDINPHVKDFNWGKSEIISYKSLDGVDLNGILIKPENFDAAKKYPLMVYIYERLTDNYHTFRLPAAGTSINPTYYASNGYLVLMPDIAYKVGHPGQSALKCVLSAVQAVADKGFVDEKAIGIQGHSWGGYQIAYMVTQTDRFKAAAAGAAVSNMVSAYGGIRWGTGLPRQFQYEKSQSRIGETPWQAPLKYIENSPIFMADRVTTPLMMLHNDADDAVPWYQGIEYYLALRRLGKEVYLLNYNGQPHGLTKKNCQRDYTLRMQQFFDHHLKGAPMPDWMAKGVPFLERDAEKEQWKKLFHPQDQKK